MILYDVSPQWVQWSTLLIPRMTKTFTIWSWTLWDDHGMSQLPAANSLVSSWATLLQATQKGITYRPSRGMLLK